MEGQRTTVDDSKVFFNLDLNIPIAGWFLNKI